MGFVQSLEHDMKLVFLFVIAALLSATYAASLQKKKKVDFWPQMQKFEDSKLKDGKFEDSKLETLILEDKSRWRSPSFGWASKDKMLEDKSRWRSPSFEWASKDKMLENKGKWRRSSFGWASK